MKRRYNGWRELKHYSEYDRKKTVRNQRILFGVGVLLVVILVVCICVFMWRRGRAEDTEASVSQESSISMTLEPVIIPTEAPTEPPIEVLVEEKIGRVILDAGHGGVDGGTFYEDVLEKNINLAVVMNIKEALEKEGVEVILTRSTDDFMDVSERTEIVNGTEADLFVSIHCNYFEDDDSVSGLECYYYNGDEVGQACAERMIEVLKENEDIKVRSAKHGGYYVLKYSELPAMLVEMGFLSNKAEREKLNSEEYQKLLAGELAEGIVLNLKELPEEEEPEEEEPEKVAE